MDRLSVVSEVTTEEVSTDGDSALGVGTMLLGTNEVLAGAVVTKMDWDWSRVEPMNKREEVNPTVMIRTEVGVIDDTESPVKEVTELASIVGRKVVIVTEDPTDAYCDVEITIDGTGKVEIASEALIGKLTDVIRLLVNS